MNAPVHPHDLARHDANEPSGRPPGIAAYVDPAQYAEGTRPRDSRRSSRARAAAAANR